jgi:hypothetical protein
VDLAKDPITTKKLDDWVGLGEDEWDASIVERVTASSGFAMGR